MDWRRFNTDRAFDVAAVVDPALLRRLHRLLSTALAEGWSEERIRRALGAPS
jgi:hypothetical protein